MRTVRWSHVCVPECMHARVMAVSPGGGCVSRTCWYARVMVVSRHLLVRVPLPSIGTPSRLPIPPERLKTNERNKRNMYINKEKVHC